MLRYLYMRMISRRVHSILQKTSCSDVQQVPDSSFSWLRSPVLIDKPCSTGLNMTRREFSCKSIHGRMFYKRRPMKVPRYQPKNYKKKWLEGSPFKKGVCVKVLIKTPRNPGSGLRKVAYVKLSTGRRVLALIPGIGHNLNVHSVVLVRGGRAKDIPACYYKCVRGKYDLLPVKGRSTSRSK